MLEERDRSIMQLSKMRIEPFKSIEPTADASETIIINTCAFLWCLYSGTSFDALKPTMRVVLVVVYFCLADCNGGVASD